MALVHPIRRSKIQLVLGALFAFSFGASSVQCGASNSSQSGGFGAGGAGAGSASSSGVGGASSTSSSTSTSSGQGGDIGIDVVGADYSNEQFFQNDPPPMSCDGGGKPPPDPGGTPECPGDKNLPGCQCPTQGAKAACWTGLRKNRYHGACKDGQTTCQINGESMLSWGPCVGETLPSGMTGKAACDCFSGGHWALDNLSPCFFSDASNKVVATTSTYLQGGTIQCPADSSAAPAEVWANDTLQADCTGTFKLCYSLKAGDGANPQPGDCTIISVCAEGYYSPANSTVTLPPLAGWLADPATLACQQKFVDSGGYGEMSVTGQSDECEMIDKVFQHVTYCPLACNGPNPPAMCAQCMAGGGGNF